MKMLEQLKKIVDENDVISFDIFDTLLFRNVYSPRDIFRIVEKEIKDKFKIDDFYNIRVESEEKSRIGKESNECTFDDIYNEVSKRTNKKIAEYAKKLEMETELKFICANPFMKEIYDYAKSKGKDIYYISDMYLSSENIYKLLEKSGYKRDKLYVSCEYYMSKCGGGQLFNKVQTDNHLNKEKWLHIGDNAVSDYQCPLEFGINAYRYKNIREYDTSVIPSTIEESIITAIQLNNVYNGLEIDYWDKFGIMKVAPLYFGFAFWLYNLTKDKSNLFFLARDGYIFEKIYDLFPKTDSFKNYIYCSRKSLQIPSLYDCSDDYLTYMMTIKNNLVNEKVLLSDMFARAQLDYKDKKYKKIIKIFGFDSFDDEITDDNYEMSKRLIASLFDDIKANIKSQRDLAIKYLKQEGMNKFKKIYVVDIGWSGSIQYAIKNLLKKDVTGYYFGTLTSNKENIYSTMFGYYFDLDYKWEDREEVMKNAMMYELLFSAPHGQTVKYEEKNGIVKPVLNKEDNSKTIEKFQTAAIDTIKEFLEYYDYFEKIDKYFATHRYVSMVRDKEYDDVVHFHTLTNDLVLNSNKKYPYVCGYKKDYIFDHFDEFSQKIEFGLWPGSFIIVDGCEKDYLEVKKKLKEKQAPNSFKKRLANYRRRYIPFKVRKMVKEIIKK